MNEVSTGKIAGDFKALIDEAEDMAKPTASQAGERMGELRPRLEKSSKTAESY